MDIVAKPDHSRRPGVDCGFDNLDILRNRHLDVSCVPATVQNLPASRLDQCSLVAKRHTVLRNRNTLTAVSSPGRVEVFARRRPPTSPAPLFDPLTFAAGSQLPDHRYDNVSSLPGSEQSLQKRSAQQRPSAVMNQNPILIGSAMINECVKTTKDTFGPC